MVDANVTPFEIETISRHGDVVRADVYLPKGAKGPFLSYLVLHLTKRGCVVCQLFHSSPSSNTARCSSISMKVMPT